MAESEAPKPIFCDEFEHKLDGGWRVVLPRDWRSLKVTELFVTESSASKGTAALRVFPRAEWEKLFDALKNDPERRKDMISLNDDIETFASRSKRVVPDKDGRITLPEALCQQIGISPQNPEVTLCGAYDSFRIWNRKKLTDLRAARTALEEMEGRKPKLQDHLGI